MKKYLLVLIASIFIITTTYSAPVTKEEAKVIAEHFYSVYGPSTKSSSIANKILVEMNEGDESFYIFSFNKGGFVIVSADDRAIPILGYSFTNSVGENAYSNVRYLFDRYKKEIADTKSIKTKSASISNKWAELRNQQSQKSIQLSEPLLTSSWNQSPIYNDSCPDESPTGCVATAMSQIMNYHKWPDSGNGWNRYTPTINPQYGEQYADFHSAVYDWINMPDILDTTSTDDQKRAIATLNYHTGVSVNMNYDVDEGSGSYSVDVLYALTSYFKYDSSSIEYITYDNSDDSDYLAKIKNEIDNNRPIYYDGFGGSGGHAWVCDGYDKSNMVHINWGWGGLYNGYFLLANMAPGEFDFTAGNAMIIGIKPGSVDQDMLWTKQASAFKNPYRATQSISVVDSRTAWAVAFDGSGKGVDAKDYTRTVDGFNWNSGKINAEGTTDFGISMISAIDENNAWVAMYNPLTGGGKIVKTNDGGNNWEHQPTALFSAPSGFPNIVHFWDANNGFCQGDPNGGRFELYTTTNGGETWLAVPQANIPKNTIGEYGVSRYYATYNDIIWFSTSKGRIFKSTDLGYKWSVSQTPLSDVPFDISFKNENIGIIQRRGGGDNKIQYKTIDGGENWTQLNSSGNFYTSDFKYVPGSDLLISAGSDFSTPFQGISYSTDDGESFTDYADFYQNLPFIEIGTSGLDAIWVGSYNEDEYSGGMWRYGNKPVTAGISTNKVDYCLNQTVIFTDNSSGSPETINWNFGDGSTPATAKGVGPHSVDYSSTGLKNVTLTVDTEGEQHSLIKSIHISDAIPNNATEIMGETFVNNGRTYIYSVEHQDNIIFNWDFPAEWTGSSSTNKIALEFSGSTFSQPLTVTPTNGCGDGLSSTLDITAGIEKDTEKDDQFSIYPNPAKNNISISGDDITDIYIYSAMGVLMKKIEGYSINSSIDISNLSSGIYYVNSTINNKSYTMPFSVVR